MTWVKRLVTRAQGTAAYRSWQRYGQARGNLLAGGVTYFAFLSVFPAIALAFTIFGILLRGHPDWLAQISDYLNKTLPGFIKDTNHKQGLIALTIPSKNTLSITGAASVIGLVLSGLGWLSAMRDAIRGIFHVEGSPGNFLTDKLRDLSVMAVFGLGIAVSAAVTGIAGAVAGYVAEHIGLGGQGWILTIVGLVVGVLLDGALVGLMLRALSGVDLTWPALRTGALAGGVGLTLLKVFGTQLLAKTLSNPLYGSIALVVGLLVWIDFISRIVLLSAALTANALDDGAELVPVTSATLHKALEGPEPRAVAAAAAGDARLGADPASRASRAALGLPTFGQRSSDRTGIAAGAVLGAVATAGTGAVVRGVVRFIRPTRRP